MFGVKDKVSQVLAEDYLILLTRNTSIENSEFSLWLKSLP